MHRIMFMLSIGISNFILLEVHLGVILFETGVRVEAWLTRTCLAVKVSTSATPRCLPVAAHHAVLILVYVGYDVQLAIEPCDRTGPPTTKFGCTDIADKLLDHLATKGDVPHCSCLLML